MLNGGPNLQIRILRLRCLLGLTSEKSLEGEETCCRRAEKKRRSERKKKEDEKIGKRDGNNTIGYHHPSPLLISFLFCASFSFYFPLLVGYLCLPGKRSATSKVVSATPNSLDYWRTSIPPASIPVHPWNNRRAIDALLAIELTPDHTWQVARYMKPSSCSCYTA